MSCPRHEELEALAFGEPVADEVRAHAAACADCARELSWLRAEAGLIARHAAAGPSSVEALIPGIEARIAARARARRVQRLAVAAAVVVAVAGAAIALRPHRGEPHEKATPTAEVALDNAEREYREAVDALEEQLAARDGRGLHRASLSRSRASLGSARMHASAGASGRVRVLEGYAAYLRSLRRALRDAEAR